MSIEISLSYSQIYDTVAALGGQQANFDVLERKTYKALPRESFVENEQCHEVAKTFITAWGEQSIDDTWRQRDTEALWRAYEYGYRQQIERLER